jgi:hypothetical protein
MCVTEEGFMEMSLVYTLLGVNDLQTLDDLVTVSEQTPGALSADQVRAVRYRDFSRKQRREVRKALYEALYTILEGAEVNRDLSMSIGLALCSAINYNSETDPRGDPGIQRLATVLKPIVTETIDEITNPNVA